MLSGLLRSGRRSCSRAFSSQAPTRVRASQQDFANSAKEAFFNDDDDDDDDSDMNMYGVDDAQMWRAEPRSMESMPQRWWHVDGRIKEALWRLHSEDAEKWNLQRLSDEFGLHEARIDAILRLKRMEKEQWKPEDLHYDMEEAVESAIEMYKLEARTEGLQEDHDDVQRLYGAYNNVHTFLQSQTGLDALKLKQTETEDEATKTMLASKIVTAEKEKKKAWNQVRNYLRPDLNEPIEDFEIMPTLKQKNAPLDLALSRPEVPPDHGPGSGETLIDSEVAKNEQLQRENRFKIVVTDISTKNDANLQVLVREKDASLRHATVNEYCRAVQAEKGIKRTKRVLFDD